MTTLTIEVPIQFPSKLAEIEQQQEERLRKILSRVVIELLDKIEKSPETELQALEEAYGQTKPIREVSFQAAAEYVLDNNLELYKRLA